MAHDLQQLADADAVAAFFALLGYDTDARMTQTPAAMGITAESLQRKIRRIQRMADQEDGILQVYLVELDTVTVAAIQGLARALRDRAGNFLLVLTDDYEELDFLLLEREVVAATATAISPPRVSVRPRVLTVARRNPGLVKLRVLRRFTYTEADADAQYDKLRSAYAVAEWSEPYFNNRALFADYFLAERLRDLPQWSEDPKPVYLRLRALYSDVREQLAGADEAATRRHLILQALEALGFGHSPVKVGEASPDYLLSSESDPAARVACLAYAWNRYLDGKDETRDRRRPEDNPGARVVSVLDSGVAGWAIVTNGKLWRLYAAAAHSRATNYYEIDLEETLAMSDPSEAFRYFWLIFRAAAFQPRSVLVEGEQRELSFVDQLLHGSSQYARRLGDRLKDRVFEEVFPELAWGFVAHIRHLDGFGADLSQQRLDQLFRGTLTLLYRLLFLLYAEARGLLPAREVRGYHQRSLTLLKAEVARAAGPIKDEVPKLLEASFSADPARTDLYDRLMELARVVDQGNASLNVPVYNGGLFLTQVEPGDQSPEAEASRFLLRHKVPDRFLALAVDRLARDEDEKRGDLVPIDYKSLGVRQLGSIYEGLLEFRLRIAPERMAIVKGRKTEEIIPYREAEEKGLTILKEGRGRQAQERTLPRGTLYLENDRRERKATGSYYTPDHIVQYIVEHAVGPVLGEHLERLRPELREAQKAYQAARKRRAGFEKAGMKGDDPEKVANAERWRAVAERLFEFRVLDPAMGSGHFLVEAVDFITDRVLDFLNGFPWNPVQAQLRTTRESILAEMDRQGIAIDAARLTDVNLLKRHVLKRCIYGVDLNPMAVELAKVSLWLDCFTLGAPLSFLDHHLKGGNSLIGTTVQAVEAELEASKRGHFGDLFGGPFQGLLAATALVEELARMPDATMEQARRSHSLFSEFERAQAPYKAALDIWVSRYFGNPRAQEFLTLVGGDLVQEIRSGGERLSPEYRQVIAQAAQLQQERRFFHWDLEFPEAFVDLQRKDWKEVDQQGFNAVIGNPPWIRQESIGQQKVAMAALFPKVYDSVADSYVYFVGRGLSVLRQNARLGMVLPNKWLRAGYGRPLRALLRADHQPLELVDFGHSPLFPDADTFPCIFIVTTPGSSHEVDPLRYCSVPRTALHNLALGAYVKQQGYEVPNVLLHEERWTLLEPDMARLLARIRAEHPTIAEMAPRSLFRGIIPGLTEAFFVDQQVRDRLVSEDPGCEPLLHRAVRGRNIQRWHPHWEGEWLILLKSSENHPWPWANVGTEAERLFSDTYPALHRHLKPFQRDLEKRQDRGRHWWELRSCSYYHELQQSKIVYQEILFHSWFAWDTEGYLHNNKVFALRTDQKHLTAILNSALMWWYMWRTIPHMKDEALAMQAFAVEQLPIAQPDAAQREEFERLVNRLVALARDQGECRRQLLSNLVADLGIERPSRKLEQFWRLDAAGFTSELRRLACRPLSPPAEEMITAEYHRLAAEFRGLLVEALRLEVQLQRAVFDLYGLTAEEIRLVRATAPPRDPLTIALEEARALGLDLSSAAGDVASWLP